MDMREILNKSYIEVIITFHRFTGPKAIFCYLTQSYASNFSSVCIYCECVWFYYQAMPILMLLRGRREKSFLPYIDPENEECGASKIILLM